MEGDNGNPVEHHEEEYERALYRQQLRQFEEFVNGNRQRPDFMQWRLQRMKTIKTLKELRGKLDTVCVGANYGKAAGSGAQLTGAISSIIGAVMSLGNSPSAKTVMNVGNLINHSGGFVGGVSNIVESYASAGYLGEVKAILDTDRELSQPLQEWLVFSRNFEANLRIVFGSDLNSIVRNNALRVFREFTLLYNPAKGLQATLDLMKKGQYSVLIGTDVKIEKLAELSRELDVFPEYQDTVIKFCTHLTEANRLVHIAKDGVEVYRNLYGEDPSPTGSRANDQTSMVPSASRDISVVTGNGTSDVASSTAQSHADCPSVRAVSMFCGFQAIDIAVSVISLVSAVRVIKDGKSKFSDALTQISNLLETELKSVAKLDE